MEPRNRQLVRSAIAAGALLTASSLAATLSDPRWGALASAFVLVGGLLAIDRLRPAAGRERSLPSRAARILLLALVGACALVYLDDPSRLPALIPIFGVVLAVPILEPAPRAHADCS